MTIVCVQNKNLQAMDRDELRAECADLITRVRSLEQSNARLQEQNGEFFDAIRRFNVSEAEWLEKQNEWGQLKAELERQITASPMPVETFATAYRRPRKTKRTSKRVASARPETVQSLPLHLL